MTPDMSVHPDTRPNDPEPTTDVLPLIEFADPPVDPPAERPAGPTVNGSAALLPGSPGQPGESRTPVEKVGRRRPLVPSARARILTWMLFAMVLTLATVGITLAAVLYNRVESEAAASVEQEVNEFTQFAAQGTDPTTGERFRSTRELLYAHLQGQYADENELIFGWTTSLIRQARQAPGDPVGDPALVRSIIDSPDSFGTVQTASGKMLWAKQTALPVGAEAPGIFVIGHLVDLERGEVSDTVRLITLVSVIALIFSSLVAWVVAGRILEPIRLVRQTAAAITEKRLNRRIPVRGKDDIAELSKSFNAMMDRLDAAFGAQRQFVDDASHELRTPITIVRGHLELMGDDPQERAETMRIVDEELDRMNRIVDDLLVLARSEQPDFVIARSTSLVELTSTVDAKVRALGDRRWVLQGIGEADVIVDQQRITQAMVQLAQNAVQHTEAGDTIGVGSSVRPGLVTFWITDSGPGVPPGDVETIFDRFSRGSTGGARTHAVGAGLGLSIVKAIALAHGGRCWVRNNPGGGATFGLELPDRPDPATPEGPTRHTPNGTRT